MKLKHSIAFFCLLVLCIQVLPVKQIGAMLFGNQVNEEVPHGLDTGKEDVAKIDFSKTDPFLLHDASHNHLFITGTQEYIHFAISLPACHAGEIPTPPPNLAA